MQWPCNVFILVQFPEEAGESQSNSPLTVSHYPSTTTFCHSELHTAQPLQFCSGVSSLMVIHPVTQISTVATYSGCVSAYSNSMSKTCSRLFEWKANRRATETITLLLYATYQGDGSNEPGSAENNGSSREAFVVGNRREEKMEEAVMGWRPGKSWRITSNFTYSAFITICALLERNLKNLNSQIALILLSVEMPTQQENSSQDFLKNRSPCCLKYTQYIHYTVFFSFW